jgi:hypothetical protein
MQVSNESYSSKIASPCIALQQWHRVMALDPPRLPRR